MGSSSHLFLPIFEHVFYFVVLFSPNKNGGTVFFISNFQSHKSVKGDVNSQKDPEIVSPPGGLKYLLGIFSPKFGGRWFIQFDEHICV